MRHHVRGLSILLLSLLGCGGSPRDVQNSSPPVDSSPPPDSSPASISIAPASAPAGSPDLTLTVTGRSFAGPAVCLTCANSVVYWNVNGHLTLLATTFVSSTQLTAVVPAALMASAVGAWVDVETFVGQDDVPTSVRPAVPFVVTP